MNIIKVSDPIFPQEHTSEGEKSFVRYITRWKSWKLNF